MTDLAPTPKRSLVADLAAQAGLEPAKFYEAIKAQCGCEHATDADFAALLMTSQAYGLNPVMRQLYLMKTKRGIQVVIPVDGYLKLMRAHPDYLSHTCVLGGEEDDAFAEATIYTKSQVAAGTPPFAHREWLKECRGNSGPWGSHPRRMLQHKAMSQAVRYCFAIYTPDDDEWTRADEQPVSVPVDVTPVVPMEEETVPADAPPVDTEGMAAQFVEDVEASGFVPPETVDEGEPIDLSKPKDGSLPWK